MTGFELLIPKLTEKIGELIGKVNDRHFAELAADILQQFKELLILVHDARDRASRADSERVEIQKKFSAFVRQHTAIVRDLEAQKKHVEEKADAQKAQTDLEKAEARQRHAQEIAVINSRHVAEIAEIYADFQKRIARSDDQNFHGVY